MRPVDHRYAAMMEEYKTLRREIEQSTQTRLLVVSFSVSAWAGFAAWLIASPKSFSAELALVLLHVPILVAFFLVYLSNRHIARVSTYIREFIEPEVEGLRWESLVTKFRNKSGLVLSTTQGAAFAFLSMSLGAFAIERTLQLEHKHWASWVDLALLAPVWLGLVVWHLPIPFLRRRGGYEGQAARIWKQVHHEELGSSSQVETNDGSSAPPADSL